MKFYSAILAIAVVLAFAACKKTNSGSKIPQISFIGIQNNTMRTLSSDSIQVQFKIVDGDGDLSDPNSSFSDIFINDSRYPDSFISYSFPAVPPELQDPAKGIEAICIFDVTGQQFELRPDHLDGDTLILNFYVEDKADHKSNTVSTPPIYLTP